MKIMSLNLNGIRSAARKDFFPWLAAQDTDVVCLQETKAQMEHVTDAVFRPEGYHSYFADAQKKGYSGVGIYCRRAPDRVVMGLGWESADSEGRYIQVDFGRLSIASLYLPSGSSGEHRQVVKYDFMEHYTPMLEAIAQDKQRDFIICGDWNIAHRNIDLKNWRNNQKNSGFLPEERAWLDTLFDEVGLVDAFRVVNQEPDQYTWWSYRGQARANNVGWRIDYQIITPGLKEKVRTATIHPEPLLSDHAPLVIEYDYPL